MLRSLAASEYTLNWQNFTGDKCARLSLIPVSWDLGIFSTNCEIISPLIYPMEIGAVGITLPFMALLP